MLRGAAVAAPPFLPPAASGAEAQAAPSRVAAQALPALSLAGKRDLGHKVWAQMQSMPNATARAAAQALLRAATEGNSSLAIVQVGACDGAWEQSNDPVQELLNDTRVRAIAMEPVPYLWAELEKRLATLPEAAGRLLAVNAALCLEAGENVPFYVVSSSFAADHPNAEHWAKRELGSFNRSHLLKHRVPERYIEQIDVPCMAPPQLFERQDSPVGHVPAEVDALIVDAEGLDDQLVKAMLKLEDFRPALVIFERKHIPRARRDEIQGLLRQLRYEPFNDNDQLVAVLEQQPTARGEEAYV